MLELKTWVGIDLACRANHEAVIIDSSEERNPTKSFSFSHDLPGFNDLCNYVKRQTGKDSLEGIGVNFEPTGGVWEVIGAYLQKQGAKVFYTRPDVVSAIRKAQSKFVKSNRIDAKTLASLHSSMPERLIPFEQIEERIKTLRMLSNQHRKIVDEIIVWKNRFVAKVESSWGHILAEVEDDQKYCKIVREFFKKFPCPHQVIKYGKGRFADWYAKNAHGNTTSALMEALWRGAVKSAELWDEMERLKAKNLNWEEQSILIQQDLRYIEFNEAELKSIKAEIREARKDVPECDVVQEIPGVGDVISVSMTSTLMPVKRFPNTKKCGGYTGFTSRHKSTGEHEVEGLKITKAGNSRLKRDLALAADTAMHLDPQLAYFAIKLLCSGKHYNKVRVAVGRKIATYGYSLLKRISNGEENVHYEFRDLDGNTISKKEAKAIAQGMWQIYKDRVKKQKSPQKPVKPWQSKRLHKQILCELLD